MADIVAKRFFASCRATLIQKISLSRKIDSSGTLVYSIVAHLEGVADFRNNIGT